MTLACGGRTARAPAAENTAAPSADSAYVAALKASLGAGVELSLVPELQAASESALSAEHRAGAIVALDPNDGRILALFSVPGDRGDPLNTPAQPASTFKSFTALAGLSDGVITPNTVLHCNGRYEFSGLTFTCTSEHGDEDVRRAVAVSCNTFFFEVGRRLEPAHLANLARALGFASTTGIEIPDRAGVVPGPPDAQHPARRVADGAGHGAYTVTLLELARAYAAIANGGRLPELHLVDARRGADGTLVRISHAAPQELGLNRAALDIVRQGLADAVAADYGRAHPFALTDHAFAGKTGGADAPPRPGEPAPATDDAVDRDSWFVGYAPPEQPTLLIAARLERIRSGDRQAGNVVSDVFARTLSQPTP
jgi:penicillin-binding protein 2